MAEYFKTISVEIKKAEAVLKHIGERAESDMASDAVNHVAFYTRLQLRKHMGDVFDKPTSRTMNSIWIKPLATPAKPEAIVKVNDDVSKGNSPAQWLRTQETGGNRNDKRMERALKIAGILSETQQVKGIAVDAYGNLSGGKVKQMLSALQAGNDATQDSKDAAKRAKWRIARRKSDGKPFGIFQMQGVHSKLFLIFTRQQQYKPRFKFFEVVQESWNEKIKEAWAKAWSRHVWKSIPAYMRGG